MRNTDQRISDSVRAWMQRLYSPLGLLASFVAGAIVVGIIAGSLFAVSRPQPPAPSLLSQSGGNPDLEIVLTPGLLTSLLQQSIAQGQAPLPLRHVQVSTSANRLTVRGEIEIAGQSVPASVDFQPMVQAGRLTMDVTGAQLASIPVPRDLGQLADGPINRQLTAATGGLPATILAANAGPDGLAIVARLHPGALASASATPKPSIKPSARPTPRSS